MPTARKLPSGSWRCQVVDHYEYRNGKKVPVRVSFTCEDPSKYGKEECERQAAEYRRTKRGFVSDLTVYDAVRKYIDSKTGVLSPSTISAYEKYLSNAFTPIETQNIRKLKESDVQLWVSRFAKTHSPKYTKNVYMLFAPAVKQAGGKEYNITLPRNKKPRVYTPTDAEVKQLIDYIMDKPVLLSAVILAAFGSLRRSEICALRGEDFDGCKVTINKAIVRNKDGAWVEKGTKTDESERVVFLPSFCVDLINPHPGRIVPLNPDALSNRFNRAVRFARLENSFSLHSLRHYYVSIAHALSIPDAYIMKTGGWSTDNVMKRHYLSVLPDVEIKQKRKLDNHFKGLVLTKMHTNAI